MLAMVVTAGGSGQLEPNDLPTPEVGPGEVLISVRAAGVNRADLLQRQGRYAQQATRRPGPVIAGIEVAGVVASLGEAVSGVAVGDRVMCMCGGGYTEFAVVDHRLLLGMPPDLSWEEAASLPVGLMTGYDALVNAGSLRFGEAVLVTAAASGVGQVTLQLASALGASPVLGTSRSADRRRHLVSQGADQALDQSAPDFVDQLRHATDGKGVDVVVDHVGASGLASHLATLAIGGRLISVGRLGGHNAEIDLNLLALRRLTVRGVTFRTRTLAEYADIADGVRSRALEHVRTGRVRPVVSQTLPLRQAAAAHELMAADRHLGKLVLIISP
jgi:NADPH2:quinone reductase